VPITIARYAISIVVAFIVTFALFWLMQFLIATGNKGREDVSTSSLLEFVRIPRDETVVAKKPKPAKPPTPETPPPQPPPPSMDNVTPDAQAMAVSAPTVNANINLSASGFGLAPTDGEYLPIVKVQPIYPRSALSRGIQGYVIVQFTVTKQGTTRDVKVVEAKPPGIFDRSAIQAAQKFKYKPRVVDGEPIEVPGVQNKITFVIED
jgi:protein TonB